MLLVNAFSSIQKTYSQKIQTKPDSKQPSFKSNPIIFTVEMQKLIEHQRFVYGRYLLFDKFEPEFLKPVTGFLEREFGFKIGHTEIENGYEAHLIDLCPSNKSILSRVQGIYMGWITRRGNTKNEATVAMTRALALGEIELRRPTIPSIVRTPLIGNLGGMSRELDGIIDCFKTQWREKFPDNTPFEHQTLQAALRELMPEKD